MRLKHNFLDLPPEQSDPERARCVVMPMPFEGTVSYKAGTANAPAEIIDASAQVELFDEELLGEFVEAGVATRGVLQPADTAAEQVAQVRRAASDVLGNGQFPLALGGEHSITAGLVAAAAEHFGDVAVLQIDAHADLRDQYEDDPHSHAAVMRRVLEITPHVAQVGVRNFSREEFDACREQVDRFITPAVIETDPGWIDRALALLGDRPVYVTIDIDGLDPSIAPGTGTPEPGGLSWRQATALLRRTCERRRVVGADIVEVRPIPPNHVTEFLAARLAYKIIAYTQQRRENG